MRHKIILAPEAANDLKLLDAHLRAEIRDALERHLRYEPTKISKSRIQYWEEIRKNISINEPD
jgi:mRNA interferase RelE/StbE